MREKGDTFKGLLVLEEASEFSASFPKSTVADVQKSPTAWAHCFLEIGDWLWARGEEEEACEMYQYALRMAQEGHQARA